MITLIVIAFWIINTVLMIASSTMTPFEYSMFSLLTFFVISFDCKRFVKRENNNG